MMDNQILLQHCLPQPRANGISCKEGAQGEGCPRRCREGGGDGGEEGGGGQGEEGRKEGEVCTSNYPDCRGGGGDATNDL